MATLEVPDPISSTLRATHTLYPPQNPGPAVWFQAWIALSSLSSAGAFSYVTSLEFKNLVIDGSTYRLPEFDGPFAQDLVSVTFVLEPLPLGGQFPIPTLRAVASLNLYH
jgi:hypothetical protein